MIKPRHVGPIDLRQVEEERVVGALGVAQRRLRRHVDRLVLGVGAILGRADVDTQIAAGAILGRHLNRELLSSVPAFEQCGLEGRRRMRQRRLAVDLRSNRGVRAHERTLVALDADLLVPDGDLESQVAFLPFRRAHRPGPVYGKRADREQVALAGQHDGRDLLDEVRCLLGNERRSHARGTRGLWHGHFVEMGDGLVHHLAVAADDLGTPLAVGLLDGFLDVRGRLLPGQDS